jgi:hypothetical protein
MDAKDKGAGGGVEFAVIPPWTSLVSIPNREYQSARIFASWHGLIEIAPTYSIFAGGDSANADAERKISGITR